MPSRTVHTFGGVFLVICCGALAAQRRDAVTLFRGTVLGADGLALKQAEIYLESTGARRPLATATVGPDGSYALATTAQGPCFLRFTAVDHQSRAVRLLLGRAQEIGLDVRLPRYEYADAYDSVTVIGDWNAFNFTTGRRLTKQADGRYTVEVETDADTVAYQLLGLVKGSQRSINGTAADWYVYDNGGDYRSVLRAVRGKATIVFDPGLLVRGKDTATIVFRDAQSSAARFYGFVKTSLGWFDAYYQAASAARQRHDSLQYDWAPTLAAMTARLRSERDTMLRQGVLLAFDRAAMMGAHVDSAVTERLLREVSPSSVWWAFGDFGQPFQMGFAYARSHRPGVSWRDAYRDSTVSRWTAAYLERVLAQHPTRSVQADALYSLVGLMRSAGQFERANGYYLRLLAEYPDASQVRVAKASFAADRVLRDGAEVPAFRFAGLGDSTVTYTRQSMLGTVYLLDFWATWCGPCIGEMPQLHQAYERFKDKGFRILSVSLDQAPELVQRFRADKWKMPWLHAYVPGGFDSPAMRQFEIVFIPRGALVDAQGKIVAVDGEVRGDKLMETLARLLP